MSPETLEGLPCRYPNHIVIALAMAGVGLLVLPAAAVAAERPGVGAKVQATKSAWGPSSHLERSGRTGEPKALQSPHIRRREEPRAQRSNLSRITAGIQARTAPLFASDAVGDTFGTGLTQIDISEMTTDTDHNSLFIDVIFTDFVSEPDSGFSDAVAGYIDLDTDQNGLTGELSWTDFLRPSGDTGMGNEFYVDLFDYDSSFGNAPLVDDLTDTIVDFVPVTFFGDGFLVKIPLDLLADDGLVDVAAILGTLDEPTDLVPEDGSLPSDDSAVRLNGDRFWVIIDWATAQGDEGPGRVVPFHSDDSGMLWFFNAKNWEILIKVLRGCAINDRYWVFAAATTDVEYELFVYDVFTGASATYFNTLGVASPAITDTDAFATCP